MFELRPGDVEAAAARAAGWLRSAGVRPGDRVAIVAGNRPEYVVLTMGALRTGIVPVLVNVSLPREQREWVLSDCDPALVLSEDAWPAFDASPVELAPWPLARPMHYTSGTTGRSKGVWSGLFPESEAQAFALDERDLWQPYPGDTYLVASPLYHSAPHRTAISALLAGARVIVRERFEAAEVARAWRDERVTGAFLVPTHLRRLLELGPGALDFSSSRRVLHAGEPCPEPLKRQALNVFPPGTLWEFYGSTEGQFTAISPDEWLERPNSVGRARAGRRLRIADPGPDGIGVVWCHAPAFARFEYWRDAAKTAAAWDDDAFTVGDLGRLDDDGYLYLVSRREDLIISGGVNVYPAEVESVLAAHPDVVDVAVFGVPDDRWGQSVCAAVISRGATGDQIAAWARERLAPAHRPKQVFVVDAFPRTATGKIRRGELVAFVDNMR